MRYKSYLGQVLELPVDLNKKRGGKMTAPPE